MFWFALVAAGLGKGTYTGASFQEMMLLIRPYLLIFAGAGIGVMLGLWLILAPGIGLIYKLGFPDARRRIPATAL